METPCNLGEASSATDVPSFSVSVVPTLSLALAFTSILTLTLALSCTSWLTSPPPPASSLLPFLPLLLFLVLHFPVSAPRPPLPPPARSSLLLPPLPFFSRLFPSCPPLFLCRPPSSLLLPPSLFLTLLSATAMMTTITWIMPLTGLRIPQPHHVVARARNVDDRAHGVRGQGGARQVTSYNWRTEEALKEL